MARRMIKFPLKMKNGAEVRSLEELRANADVESIMKYYVSGQLSLWCRAFGYEDIPAGITEINESFVKSVMDLIGIKVSAEEMQEYIKNSFGVADTGKITADIENEEEIIDNADVKDKLKEYTDINLDDYEISVVPVENENGKIEKYRISVTCEKSDQYTRFSIPYNITTRYTKDRFEQDMYRKITNCFRILEEEEKYNKSNFATMEVGEKFLFGRWENKAIEWQVIKKNANSIYVICTDILCYTEFKIEESFDWTGCNVKKWLNTNFYNSAFEEEEKKFIGDVCGDKITLLSKNEVETLLSDEIRKVGESTSPPWILRSYCDYSPSNRTVQFYYVYPSGRINYSNISHSIIGVRPAFEIVF